MRLATLLGPDLKATLATDPEELREALEEFHPEDIAEVLSEISGEDAVALMRVLPDDYAAQVLERLDDEVRARLLELMGTAQAATILTEMSADDRADAIQELPESVAEKILDQIEKVEPELAEETRELVSYPADSAGGLMTTEYVSLPPETKVWQAIEEVRRASVEGQAETISFIYVIAFGNMLVGVVSLRELILADPGRELSAIMTQNLVKVLPTAHQEEVARSIAKYDLAAIPVVDDQGHMLGLVTVDDVVDVVIEEATEDAQRMGAVVPTDDAYFETPFWVFIRKRAMWLIVLFIGELLTASVMKSYEREMQNALDLVLFIPLIISSGGNSGSQSSSLIIRALAIGEVAPGDWYKVLIREVSMGITLGLILGVVGFARVFFFGSNFNIPMSLAVSISVIAIVTLGTLTGSLLPLAIKRVGLDPAVSSTPFIASLVDVIGLALYFTVANAILIAGAP